MTRLDVAALREAGERATGGEWFADDRGWVTSAIDPNRPGEEVDVIGSGRIEDLRFCALARTALPEALTEIEELRAECERLRGELEVALVAVRDEFPAVVEIIRTERDTAIRERDEARNALKDPIRHPDCYLCSGCRGTWMCERHQRAGFMRTEKIDLECRLREAEKERDAGLERESLARIDRQQVDAQYLSVATERNEALARVALLARLVDEATALIRRHGYGSDAERIRKEAK